MSGQSVRRSQFITTYGPGAILEGPSGPRVIPSLDLSNIFDNNPANTFEITDLRLSTALLRGASIVRLPSNAELGVPETREVYETFPFPSWALCTRHNILYLKRQGSGGRACPQCPPLSSEAQAWNQVRRQAIRFIRACPQGHLDDVEWYRVVEHRRQNCTPTHYEWRGGGSALRNISLICPECRGTGNLGLAYSRSWPCSGRFPERGSDRPGCNAEAQIIQRGAANLRMAEIYSALTIPPSDTRLHRLLESPAVQQALVLVGDAIRSKNDLITHLQRLVPRFIGQGVVDEINRFQEQDILAALEQIYHSNLPQDNQTMRLQEFEALKRAAEVGAPPQPSNTPGAPYQFEVIRGDIRQCTGPGGHILRVTPISRLRVVMVQRGYRRLDPLNSEIVDVSFEDSGGRRWYPGTELYGEGIFIDLSPESLANGYHFSLQAATAWAEARSDPDRYGQRLRTSEEQDYLHPVFVWWHTLAHRIINALSIDSGYSSAAVRERIYVDIDEETGAATGGMLLYTAQPGGDGTLGGMIALVPHFDHVIQSALNTVDSCSNDPLCGDEVFRPGKYNGAACYACQLVSETSCEHRNTRLDRNLLINNLP